MTEHPYAAALAAAEPDEFLRLERESGGHARFADLDRLAANVIAAALAGRQVAAIAPGQRGAKNSDVLTLATIGPQEHSLIRQAHTLSAQQERGAWHLAEQVSLKAGVLNLPAYLRHHPWHAITLAAEDTARVHLGSTPDAMAAWSLLIPLFDDLMAPVATRAAGSAKPVQDQRRNWTEITAAYRALGVPGTPRTDVFGYGGGWHRLDRAGQVRARLALLDELSRLDPLQLAARFRATRLRALIAATLKKAREGTPPARKVLTKALQPALSAYFGGDWPAFLDHLGLPRDPAEEIAPALPGARPQAAPATQGTGTRTGNGPGSGPGDVQATLAALLGQDGAESPVRRRTDTLMRWWSQFDAVHARQTPGMPPLWGLVEDTPYAIGAGPGPVRQLYRRLMTPDLVAEVDRLWDGVTLPRWPENIVSEPYPHKLMAETLGPALAFWHGLALTAWFVCEGPASRTTIPGLRAYHARRLTELEQAGTPVHLSVFDELEHAERLLGPPQPVYAHGGHLATGERRAGFEALRDIITRHRRGWSHRYLAEYLRHRWHGELTGVAYEVNKFAAARGRLPTFKQFARFAATAADHWFNGDLAGLYAALGETAPAGSQRVDLLAGTAHDFVDAVYAALGGPPYEEVMRLPGTPLADECRQKAKLAAAAVSFLQIAEALGRAPEKAEFGAGRHAWEWAGGLDRGWPIYCDAIETALKRNDVPGRGRRA
ncbi:stress protein [Nonomuraea sp. NN258]|uniref:stress protein n=1 Tax=Nonomuraea antri TaxID=2730852 RepID=UPI001569964B|nr:stress protein [Nonomuraea antri]NRQ38774.1 stress protein [Nonomuraea antri]